jgi:hypothetical protein
MLKNVVVVAVSMRLHPNNPTWAFLDVLFNLFAKKAVRLLIHTQFTTADIMRFKWFIMLNT